MTITYSDTQKALPVDQLHHLFFSAGWTDPTLDDPDSHMYENFNKPFINSTLVISAWDGERLVGAVRVLSDKVIRSVIYDLVIDPKFQNKGIGKELIKRCIAHYPNSEWLVQTTAETAPYYQKHGFKINTDTFLTIPSLYQNDT
ncbi:MAG: GNAT family N-acetyltransferase [Defluviitaleaceae bacterium]|nr:GNAT family N-acetyltransferase [Defluviitaleaceae bacterium]MCL2263650.1 GNAT family N-acetyltransferase [Defluviitaleaceae bacterium]MCL2263883.1 GNAT family N-acetyltransferase [Defluviitaleaceae bacterium]